MFLAFGCEEGCQGVKLKERIHELERESAAKDQELVTAKQEIKTADEWTNFHIAEKVKLQQELARMREALELARDALYNPFEPHNQSISYARVSAALSEPMNEHVHSPAEDEKHG